MRLDQLPRHISLQIAHNPHAALYQTAAEYLEHANAEVGDELTHLDYLAIVITDDLWEAHWHPNTPVGSCALYAPSIERLTHLLEARARRDGIPHPADPHQTIDDVGRPQMGPRRPIDLTSGFQRPTEDPEDPESS